jgi:aromatic ring hydroxylase
MTHRKSILGFSITVAAIALIGMVTTTSLNAQAQPDSSQQIRNYLIKAIQALDNGDNSEAIRQLQLTTDQIGTPAGQNVETVESNNGAGGSNNDESENEDEGEGSEEGEDEDEDEPGDIDTNDEED